ncbi:unnamed protein product [Clavelina lepadiformis]|uniref:Protein FAM81A n=1 Tax=Clavelina lepadiformis TaxID=159417 RepID=A0ABP0FA21_CLALP
MSDIVEVYKDRGSTIVVQRSPKNRRKINNLEDRIWQQEKTTQALVEKAYELKEQLTEKFRPTGMDAALQQLWHEHIRTITSTVKQLSRDLETVKYEIALRDSHVQDASLQTRNVGNLAQAGVADLRGRVVRCDTSISQLAHDVRLVTTTSQLETDRLKQAADNNKSKAEQMEKEIIELTKRMDYLLTEQEGKIRTIKGDSDQQMEVIDSRIKHILEDIRLTMESNKRWAESERLRIEQQLIQIVEMNASKAQTKQENFESKMLERMESLQRSIEECREECKKCREEVNQKAHKDDALKRIDKLNAHMETEFKRLKNEYRDGFESVKESINTTNRLVNGKVKLVKDELSREITNVKKMVVLI